jgi:polyisoprenoid-binding protein YceI
MIIPAEALVFTFKEGLLSPLAHDLKLRVQRLEVDVDGERAVKATFDAASLKVLATRKDGADHPGLLPEFAFSEIEQNIRNEVLKAAQHPQVRFVSTQVTPREVLGDLTLCGVTKEIRCARDGDRVEVRLDQRDFGIKPYTAMLGTLKVKPEVVVQVRLIRPAL